jgi:hypothetical protein
MDLLIPIGTPQRSFRFLSAGAVDTEGIPRTVEIIVTGRDAAVAAIHKDGGGLGDVDAIVQGGANYVAPQDMADDHKDDGVDGRGQHRGLAGHEEPLGAGGNGQKNAG